MVGKSNFSEGCWGGDEMGPPGVLTSSAEYKSFRASVIFTNAQVTDAFDQELHIMMIRCL